MEKNVTAAGAAQALELRTRAREHKRLANHHRRKARELMRQADLAEAGIDIPTDTAQEAQS